MAAVEMLLRLHLTAGVTATVDEVVAALSPVANALPSCRLFRGLGDEALRRSSFAGVVGALQPFDVVVEMRAGSDPAGAARALRDRLPIDAPAAGTSVVAATEHVLLPGDSPVAFHYVLHRCPGLSFADFSHHWRHRHTRRRVPPISGYRQVHVEHGATLAVAAALGVDAGDYDGVAVAQYRDMEHFLAVSADPAIAVDARHDEERFIDHARSAAALVAPVSLS